MRTPPEAEVPGFEPNQALLIRQELHRVLASSSFSSSKKCSDFLEYAVEQTLRGRSGHDLKERTLGVELFGLAPDFDQSENAIVRVSASEVRKKLAQCYVEGGPDHAVRIGLPPGAYAAEFLWNRGEAPAPARASDKARLPGRRIVFGVAGLVLVAVLLAVWATRRGSDDATAISQFWGPLVRSPKPVLVCLANPVGFVPARDIVKRYLSTLSEEAQLEPYIVPPASVPSDKFVPVTDQFVGVGDAHAAIGFCSYLSRVNKPFEVQIGNSTSFADLRESPSILIGAYSNRWTHEMTSQLRFVFGRVGQDNAVRDRNESDRRWVLRDMSSDWKVAVDYAIISRMLDSKTGQALVCAGGLTNYGTQAAGEFLTNPVYLERAMRNAPADWPGKNLQIVVQTKVIEATPGPPEVLATHFW